MPNKTVHVKSRKALQDEDREEALKYREEMWSQQGPKTPCEIRNAKGEQGIEIGVIEKPQTIEKPQKSKTHQE